ncbi:MAG: hypothetical protein WDN50_25570 [Bradyrhizobium sp.]
MHIQSEQIEGKIKNRQRTEIISLQERTAPRRLSTAQCSGIVDVLKPFSGRKARVATYVTDGEGSTLGQMIVVCLRAANINTEAGMATILPWSGFFSGVSVDGEDKELVDVLKNALSVEGGLVVTPGKGYFAGNQATGTETENAQAVLIVVGVKRLNLLPLSSPSPCSSRSHWLPLGNFATSAPRQD